MAEYPNVTIETEFKDWDSHTATVIDVAELPDAPDIIWGNQGYGEDGTLVGAGLIASLEPYYEAYGWDQWHGPGAMDQWRFTEDGTFGEGPRWGISESAEFVGVFCNKEKLANLGLEVPTTFAEFEEALAAAADAGEIPIKLGNLGGFPAMHVASIAQGAFVDAAICVPGSSARKAPTTPPPTISPACRPSKVGREGLGQPGCERPRLRPGLAGVRRR